MIYPKLSDGTIDWCVMCKHEDNEFYDLCCECEYSENSDDPPTKYEPKPMTNADSIRSMSEEELADWVWGAETAGRAYGPRGKKAWLDWLRQEARS